ncbi:hypothetical protein [Cohnella yongneupensis]|uniref:Uncharacterized protein n=1 Tax=Cohnella yongneupensis TaxID=425006 RepID=A0ABW0QX23_9BACL
MSSELISVTFTDGRQTDTNPLDMRNLAGTTFAVSTRVPGVPGEAFDLMAWYTAAARDQEGTVNPAPEPTHLLVRAADGFEAVVPKSQLKGALFQFAIDGMPLTKGGPLRLYVPDGTSACLNVKSVVSVVLAADDSLGDEAGYGHRHVPRRVR